MKSVINIGFACKFECALLYYYLMFKVPFGRILVK